MNEDETEVYGKFYFGDCEAAISLTLRDIQNAAVSLCDVSGLYKIADVADEDAGKIAAALLVWAGENANCQFHA